MRMSKELLEVYTIYCKNYNLATLALRKVCTHTLPYNHMHPRSHTLILYSSCLCYSLYCIVISHGPLQQHLLVYVTVVGWILPGLLYCILLPQLHCLYILPPCSVRQPSFYPTCFPFPLSPNAPQYEEDPATVTKLQECMEMVRCKTVSWDLGSMLIKPVQRIMRYHLLLTQLRKVSTL